MRKANKEAFKKRSIMLPDSFVEEMAEVRDAVGAQSDSEVLRRAFRLYHRLIKKDGEVLIKDNKTGDIREIELI